MPKKQKQNKADLADEKENSKEEETGQAEKVRLKKTKGENNNEEVETADKQWEKIEAIFNAAKEAYQSGSSDFDSILEGLIETLQNLRNEESDRNGLGGLGVGGPEMDIPEEARTEEAEES